MALVPWSSLHVKVTLFPFGASRPCKHLCLPRLLAVAFRRTAVTCNRYHSALGVATCGALTSPFVSETSFAGESGPRPPSPTPGAALVARQACACASRGRDPAPSLLVTPRVGSRVLLRVRPSRDRVRPPCPMRRPGSSGECTWRLRQSPPFAALAGDPRPGDSDSTCYQRTVVEAGGSAWFARGAKVKVSACRSLLAAPGDGPCFASPSF